MNTWLSSKGAAAYLGICTKSLKKMRDEGILPFHSMSENNSGRKMIWYKKEDIDRVINKNRI